MAKMTDAEVRAELERIGLNVIYHHNCKVDCDYCKGFRLLAESQQALGRISIKSPGIKETFEGERSCPHCEYMIEIARTHYKGGSNG